MAVGGEIAAAAQVRAEIRGLRRAEVCYGQCFFNVKLPGKSVRSHAAIVENTVGHIGILLNLRNDQPRANRVERAGGDKEDVSALDRDGAEDLGQSSVRRPAGQLFSGNLLPEAIVEAGAGGGVQNHPHLRFAVLALVRQSVGVGGVNLDGEILPGVNEFDEHGEIFKLTAVGAQDLRASLFYIGGEGLAGIRAVFQYGGPIGVAGEDPGLRQGRQIAENAKIRFQALPAPDIVLTGG